MVSKRTDRGREVEGEGDGVVEGIGGRLGTTEGVLETAEGVLDDTGVGVVLEILTSQLFFPSRFEYSRLSRVRLQPRVIRL